MFNDCSLSVRNKNKRPMGHNAHLSELLLKLIFSTILQSFSSTHLKAFDGVNFVVFFFIYLNYFFFYNFGCHVNQSNSTTWKEFRCLVEDFSRNISVKQFCPNICSKIEKWTTFAFPIIRLWKLEVATAIKAHQQWNYKILFYFFLLIGCHGNQSNSDS